MSAMKRLPIVYLLILLVVQVALSQRIDKPTLTPKPCTDEQKITVQQGIALHDAKRYDEAVAKYQQVVEANPDCTMVLYELAMTYYTKGEKTKAMETAYKGSKYKADELPLFYMAMANVLDDIGKSEEAVR